MKRISSTLLCACLLTATGAYAEHPRLVLTSDDVAEIHTNLEQTPLFLSSMAAARAEVDAEIQFGIDTPIPKDYSGGYTHERHKKNYSVAQQAGALYLLTGEEKYAEYVREMLLQYAKMYPSLPLHPKPRSYARGKLFWQCLNDANWLMYMSQAYDAVHEYLSDDERLVLENELFRPFADHISVDSPQFFNRIHNHSTWGTAAVGMIGLVLDDDELVHRALYGLDIENFSNDRDNDGGFIRREGDEAGFFANLENAFSPDGYYTEGPYYQRYAMHPFLVFAQSLHNSKYPEQAFERNDGVLLKAVETLVQLTDKDGEFFPLNDAQKGMSLMANELVTAVDIAYQVSGNPKLLSIVEMQDRVLLDGAGYSAARAIADGDQQPFEKVSVRFTDGKDGSEGGLAILRSDNERLSLLFKYTSQGLSHGHYDKLSYSLYSDGQEVLQDYGMVRFVNIGQKGGGNYLPENNSWAKQTVAHNTLVINATSHFRGKYDIGSKHHSDLVFFNVENPDAQVVSAKEDNAYPDTSVKRTLALLKIEALPNPVVLDIIEVDSAQSNQYDLPFHYFGQIIDTNFSYETEPSPSVLGTEHGYQHLYLEAKAQLNDSNLKFTWLNNNEIFTLTALSEIKDQALFLRLGANDPRFNLRTDPAFIHRRSGGHETVFVNVIEPHGRYSPITEIGTNINSEISELSVIAQTDDHIGISIKTTNGSQAIFALARNVSELKTHKIAFEDRTLEWTGSFGYTEVDL